MKSDYTFWDELDALERGELLNQVLGEQEAGPSSLGQFEER